MSKYTLVILAMLSYLLYGQTSTNYYKLNKINFLHPAHEEKTILTWKNTETQYLQLNSVFIDDGKVNFVYTIHSNNSASTVPGTGTIIWGDELMERKKELAKYILPWCGTEPEYISQTVTAKGINKGQILINSIARLSTIVYNGQVFPIKFKDSLATFRRVLTTINDKTIFVIMLDS